MKHNNGVWNSISRFRLPMTTKYLQQISSYAALAVGLFSAMATLVCCGQGTLQFQNLDFEAAYNLPAYESIYVQTTNALPGWVAFSGSNSLALVAYNISTFFPEVALYGSNYTHLSGSFSARLLGGGSISQTGLVPTNAQTLLFSSSVSDPSGRVSLGGQILTCYALSRGPNYTVFWADIPTAAGRTSTLSFWGIGYLDDILFSPDRIPEPSALALFGLGGVLLVTRRRLNV